MIKRDENETKADILAGEDMERRGEAQCDTCLQVCRKENMKYGLCAGCRCKECGEKLVEIVRNYDKCVECDALHYWSEARGVWRFIGYPIEIQLLCEVLKGENNAAT